MYSPQSGAVLIICPCLQITRVHKNKEHVEVEYVVSSNRSYFNYGVF